MLSDGLTLGGSDCNLGGAAFFGGGMALLGNSVKGAPLSGMAAIVPAFMSKVGIFAMALGGGTNV